MHNTNNKRLHTNSCHCLNSDLKYVLNRFPDQLMSSLYSKKVTKVSEHNRAFHSRHNKKKINTLVTNLVKSQKNNNLKLFGIVDIYSIKQQQF